MAPSGKGTDCVSREYGVSSMINVPYLQMYVCCRYRFLTILRAHFAAFGIV